MNEGQCVYKCLLSLDWLTMSIQSQQLYNVIITAERALHGHIANKRRKWADFIVCFLEEWSRKFWFIGGRCTWISVYWRKVHVNFVLLEEGTRKFCFIGGRYTWILVYWRKVHVNFGWLEEGTRGICWWSRYGSWNGHHLSICTDFLASIFTQYTFISLFFFFLFSIQWPSQMWRHSRVKADYVRSHNYR
jgi:hypothetical protein